MYTNRHTSLGYLEIGKQSVLLFPFSPQQALKGGFARLQSCFGELGALPREGVFQPKEDAVVQAVLDGLQQFKQYTGQGMAGACLSSSSVEVRSGRGQKARGLSASEEWPKVETRQNCTSAFLHLISRMLPLPGSPMGVSRKNPAIVLWCQWPVG